MDLEETLKAENAALRASIFALLQAVTAEGTRPTRARIRLTADDMLARAFPAGTEQAEHAAVALEEIFEGFGSHL